MENVLIDAMDLLGLSSTLMRYPGDTMATHFDNPADSQRYYSSGMALDEGLGIFCTFSIWHDTTRCPFVRSTILSVPTLNLRHGTMMSMLIIKFFKYRKKKLVVNPENGKAIVADIGDAGPAPHG